MQHHCVIVNNIFQFEIKKKRNRIKDIQQFNWVSIDEKDL